MTLPPPTRDEIARLARDLGFPLPDEDVDAYRDLAANALTAYAHVAELPGARPRVRYPRDGGKPPADGENPLNAWAWRVTVRGADDGPLAGARVAVKANTSVAGVPLTAGSRILDGFTPDADAVVVERVLDAGGTLTGTATCEDLAFSGGSHTSATGPVRNPRDVSRMAGGSSSGSAALVAAGAVDVAVGSSQGGSLLVPGAWCGVVAVKPTHDRVPYAGILPVDASLDDAGPLAPTVRDAARLLDVLSGDGTMETAVADGVDDARVGVLQEGFAWPDMTDPRVDAVVRDAVTRRFPGAGAHVVDASVPLHRHAWCLLPAISNEAAVDSLVHGHAVGTGREGPYPTGLGPAFAEGWKARAQEVAPTAKLALLVGALARDRGHGRFYAMAQNARAALRAAYDEAFRECDVLVMPTVPYAAPPLPARDAQVREVVDAGTRMLFNACAWDVTGYPAVTVPAGTVDGLPVGVTIAGRSGEDATVLRFAHAFEQTA